MQIINNRLVHEENAEDMMQNYGAIHIIIFWNRTGTDKRLAWDSLPTLTHEPATSIRE